MKRCSRTGIVWLTLQPTHWLVVQVSNPPVRSQQSRCRKISTSHWFNL